MDEIMLRSGVPPHMGQSPALGSEANSSRRETESAIEASRIVRFID
jgi:hypothetical protein